MEEMQTTTLDSLDNSPLMKPLVEKLRGDEPFIWNLKPEEAETLLTISNTFNRVPSPAKVKGYVAAILRGEWIYNNATIGFYEDGRMADGQHRVKAIADSRTTIRTVIVPGLSPEAFKTIDLGKNRSAKDSLIMEGHTHPGVKAMAISNVLKYMLHKKLRNVPTPTTSQVLKFVGGHSSPIREICNFSVSLQDTHGVFISPGLVAASALILYVHNMKLEKGFVDFITDAYSGQETNNQKPAYQLHRLLQKHLGAKNKKLGKLTQEGVCGSILKAYKLESQGKECHSMEDIKYPARKNELFSVCL